MKLILIVQFLKFKTKSELLRDTGYRILAGVS